MQFRQIVAQTLRKRPKTLLRWLILTTVVVFLLKTLIEHWHEVARLRLSAASLASLAIAIGMTLLAHIFAGVVWAWILKDLNRPVSAVWSVRTYLKTNIAKYLPGNVWHFYGRVAAAKQLGIPVGTATLSVLLEPLLMVAAACILAVVGAPEYSIGNLPIAPLQGFILVAIVCLVHPRVLNVLLKQLSKLRQSKPLRIRRYPLRPLLGELGFLGIRSLGFVFTVLAVRSVEFSDLPMLIGAFALAWLVGFILPGLPGGIGVFEAVIVALLGQHFTAAQILATVALYRLMNTIAEGTGAALVVLDEKRSL